MYISHCRFYFTNLILHNAIYLVMLIAFIRAVNKINIAPIYSQHML